MKATTEAAFESLIVEHLTTHGGYVARAPGAFDRQRALIADDLLAYVRDTQPELWEKQRGIHGDALEATLLDAFDQVTAQRGVLHVLRHGFKFYGKRVRVATFRPTHGLNPEVQALYARNCVAVARQVHFDPKQTKLSIDLVLFVNGIPVVTAELKNALTSQSAADAVKQYRDDRDPQAPIFRFKRRALVHFAVGSDAVRMTTRLAGASTYFLPFDRGNGTAGGNRSVKGKHRTHYLWEETWQRDSLLDILARFVHLQVEETLGVDGRTRRREAMIFPRYHQLDCVRRLVAATRAAGAGACGLRVTGGDVVDPDRVAVTIHGDVAEIEAVIEAVARGRRPDERLSPDEVSDRVGAGMRLAAGERVHWPDDEADEGVVLCEGGAWFVRWDRRLEDADEADSSPIDPRTGRLLDFDPPHGPLFVRRVDGEGRR